ncbi:MAG: ribbon-helix-helix protein, CopG family [Prochloraceae cyanobacterium]|nr:ribbon-helix-helix protein, CopG family [Prochloraceae cyanobacterium]
MVRISATIPEDIVEKFKEYCKQERRSMSAQITFLMEKALEQKEEEQQQKQKKD